MAHENTWSSLEDSQPTGSALLGQVDDFVRQTRQMVRERIALEHDFNFLINDQQGYHRQGSARVWVSDTQPTSPIPDPTSTETVGSETIGRCWFKPSTGEYFVYDKTSASWIPVNLTTLQMAALLHAMTAKTSLADNDEFVLADSAATYGPKKTLWSTVKSVIKTALSIGGSNALTEDDIGDGTSYKRISAAKADKINAGTYSEDDLADGTSYKRVQAVKADAINGGTYSQDDIADGTSYARLQKAKADALNAGTQVAPTAAGAADANAIAAASGSTLGARLETLTGQAIKTTALTAGADWADITDNIINSAALHIIKMYDSGGYINFWFVGTSREGNAVVVSNTPTPHQTLSFQKILVDSATHKLQCKAPSYNTTITCKTIMANP